MVISPEILLDKVRGSIIGGACGDALGYIVEFVGSYRAIEAQYGEGGLKEYSTCYPWLGTGSTRNQEALFSDDTQMTLYTIEGISEAAHTGKPFIDAIRDAYLAWYGGQTGEEINISYDSKLSHITELNQRRAPGNNCLTALFAISKASEPHNNSKGCGGIMRIAPIGLYGAAHHWDPQQIARIAGETAELTHLHPLSTLSSAVCAVIVALCVEESAVDCGKFKRIIETATDIVSEVYGTEIHYLSTLKRIITNAIQLVSDPRPDWQVIEDSIGEGWVAEETLAIALFSVLRHIDDFDACLICAVNHGGDSDSTGAVAGNILGAILGYTAIPHKYLNRLQLLPLLTQFADKLVISSN